MNNLLDTLENDLERALALQNTLLDRATGKGEDEIAYKQLRQFVRVCRSFSSRDI